MKLRNILNTLLISSVIFLFCVSSLVLAAPTQFTYENKAMGVKLTGPEGWFIAQIKMVEKQGSKTAEYSTALESIKETTKKLGILVIFLKYPIDSPKLSSEIKLHVREISPAESKVFKTAIDVANDTLNTIKNSTNLKDFRIIKKPTKIMLAGQDGANFIYEGTSLRIGGQEIRMKFSVYKIIKGKIIYTLSFTDTAEDFDSNLVALESSVNTFVIN